MSQNSTPQYVTLEQPFGLDFSPVHCPICGQSTIDMEAGGTTPCSHLAFIYVGDAGDFEYKSEAFKEKWQSIDIEDLGFDNFSQCLQKAGYDDKLLAMEVSCGGMACGPVWFTNVYGFDYATMADEDES